MICSKNDVILSSLVSWLFSLFVVRFKYEMYSEPVLHAIALLLRF